MFNMGFSEMAIIGIIALIFIGPKQLPEVARVVGRLLNELKRATGDLSGSYVKARDEADQMLRNSNQNIKEKLTKAVEASVFSEDEKEPAPTVEPEAKKHE